MSKYYVGKASKSKQLTMRLAQHYFDQGVIASFHLLRDPISSGWIVCIEGTSGTSWTLQTTRGEVRSFASLDSAVKAVEDTGMRVSTLNIVV